MLTSKLHPHTWLGDRAWFDDHLMLTNLSALISLGMWRTSVCEIGVNITIVMMWRTPVCEIWVHNYGNEVNSGNIKKVTLEVSYLACYVEAYIWYFRSYMYHHWIYTVYHCFLIWISLDEVSLWRSIPILCANKCRASNDICMILSELASHSSLWTELGFGVRFNLKWYRDFDFFVIVLPLQWESLYQPFQYR